MDLARLLAKTQKTKTCWLWLGHKTLSGYGVVGHEGKVFRAHRLMYILAVGPIPVGLCVCHRCDVRNCINPGHLFLGTHTDNMRDSVRKGRHAWRDPDALRKTINASLDKHPKGEKHHMAKLSPDLVLEMRALRKCGLTIKTIADKYGVKWPTAYSAITGSTWSHLEAR